MTDLPDEIWVGRLSGTQFLGANDKVLNGMKTQYTRTELYAALKSENEKMREALQLAVKQMTIEDLIFPEQPALGSVLQICREALPKQTEE